MIAHLTGTVFSKQPNAVIIDVNGVGYEVVIPMSTFYDLGDVGAPVALRIHTYVREDALQLFGFRTSREKDLFLRLTSVSGIGPKLAITILSGMQPDELIPAIHGGDLARLTSIPGIGKKTAERLIIELRDRIGALLGPDAELLPTGTQTAMSGDSVREDATAALLALGYQKAQAEKAVSQVLARESNHTIEHVLRQSLRLLSRS